jgi:hypothetical protein
VVYETATPVFFFSAIFYAQNTKQKEGPLRTLSSDWRATTLPVEPELPSSRDPDGGVTIEDVTSFGDPEGVVEIAANRRWADWLDSVAAAQWFE